MDKDNILNKALCNLKEDIPIIWEYNDCLIISVFNKKANKIKIRLDKF